MPFRFLESLIVSGVNRLAERRSARPKSLPLVALQPVQAGHVLLGFAPGAGAARERNGFPSERFPIVLCPEDRKRHVYVLGATGTGKTTLLLKLIENDLAQGKNLCVLDLRGDLVDRLLPRLAATDVENTGTAVKRLTLLDLRGEAHSLAFNPLAAEDGHNERDYHDRAYLVLAALQAGAQSWGVQLEETLRNCLLALAATGGTLLEIEPLLTDAAFRARTIAKLRVAGVDDEQVSSYFARYDALSREKHVTWSGPVLNKVTPYLSLPPLRRMLGQSEVLPLRRLFDHEGGSVLLVSLAADRLHGAAHLARALLLACLENMVMARAAIPEPQRRPFSLYVDEFENLASPRFLSLIAEGRRMGLWLTLSHQNLAQVGTDLRAALRANVHTLLLFQTGAQDALEMASEVIAIEGADGGAPALPSWQRKSQEQNDEEFSREQVKRLLMSQKTGETLLVRRGEAAVRVKVVASPEPKVEPAHVVQMRAAALERCARKSSEVDALLRAKRSGTPSPDQTPQTTGPQTTSSPATEPATEAPAYRIVQSKAPGRFRPKANPSSQDPEMG